MKKVQFNAIHMLFVVLLVVSFLLPTTLVAQSNDITGRWVGTLQQPDSTFIFELSITQNGDDLSGTTRITKEDYYGVMSFTGSIQGTTVNIQETAIIDTSATPGFRWCIKSLELNLDANSSILDGTWNDPGCNSGTLNVTKRTSSTPVVLVHGLNDTASGWDAYKTSPFLPSLGLTEADIWAIDTLDTGGGKQVINQIGWTTATIDENARRLRDYIDMVKQKTKVSKVDIVAHSMGGLIARRYIAHYMSMTSPDVNKLIMLGTPNAGSVTAEVVVSLLLLHPFAKPIALVGWNYPAILELMPSYLLAWNVSNSERYGVPFYAVAGNMGLACLRNPIEPIPNDIIVSYVSVFSIPMTGGWEFPNNTLGDCNGIHTGMRSQYSTQYGGGPEIFNQYVRLLLQDSTPIAGSLTLNDDSINSSNVLAEIASTQITHAVSDTLQLNQALELPQEIEQTTQAVFTVMGDPDQMVVSLRDPNGQTITSTSPSIQYLQLDKNILPLTIYAVQEPTPGKWTIIVEPNSQTSLDGVPISAAAIIDSDLRLTTPLSSGVLYVNDTVRVIAQIQSNSAPVTEATVSANLLDPWGVAFTASLRDDGQQGDDVANDGIYTYIFTSNRPGVYGGTISASGTYDGRPFDRSKAWAVPVEGTMLYLPVIQR